MWFILISSRAHVHKFFFGRGHIDWPITSCFGNIGHLNINTSLDLDYRIKTNVFPISLPFQFIYMRIKLWAHPGDKIEVLLGTTWGKTWKFGELHGIMMKNMLGTHGNKEKNKKKGPSPHTQNKKIGPIMSAC